MPYSKWLGTGFRTLAAYGAVGPPLQDALTAASYPAREDALVRAVTTLAALRAARSLYDAWLG